MNHSNNYINTCMSNNLTIINSLLITIPKSLFQIILSKEIFWPFWSFKYFFSFHITEFLSQIITISIHQIKVILAHLEIHIVGHIWEDSWLDFTRIKKIPFGTSLKDSFDCTSNLTPISIKIKSLKKNSISNSGWSWVISWTWGIEE